MQQSTSSLWVEVFLVLIPTFHARLQPWAGTRFGSLYQVHVHVDFLSFNTSIHVHLQCMVLSPDLECSWLQGMCTYDHINLDNCTFWARPFTILLSQHISLSLVGASYQTPPRMYVCMYTWAGNFGLIQGEPERAPNTRETGSDVYIYILYLFICAWSCTAMTQCACSDTTW